MAFTDDIKGQNTQLYPVVVIDGVYYSTNNVTIDGNYCKPILMNIPSIKESIDIESRKFKISNVSLDFNNFPFEGKRFSDQLSETSLINKEAIIYFKSPSELKELFRGTIRRISHDDEKVRVDLEDLTEKEAHKDLPSEILPDTEGILEKYRNKPKPMVYGSVDKSPVVLGSNNKIIIDYKEIDALDDTKTDFAGDSISPFKIELDGKYMGVLPNIDEDLGTFDINVSEEEPSEGEEEIQQGLKQWELVGNEIVLAANSLTSRGILQCKGVFKPRTIELESLENQQNFTDDEVAQMTDDIYTNQSIVDIESNTNFIASGDGSQFRMLRLKIFTDISVNDAIEGSDGFSSRVRKIALNGYLLPIAQLEIGHYQLMKIYPVTTGIPTNLQEFDFYNEIYGLSGDGYDLTGLFRFGTADYSIYDSNYVVPEEYDIDIQPTLNIEGTSEATYIPAIYMYDICGAGNKKNNGTYLIDFRIHGAWDDGTLDDIPASAQLALEGYFKEIDFNAIADIQKVFTKQFYVDVKGRTNQYDNHPYITINQSNLLDVLNSYQGYFESEYNEISGVLIQYRAYQDNLQTSTLTQSELVQIENFLSLHTDFTHKRDFIIENPIDIIYDLVRTELGYNAINQADYEEARAEHSDWKFAFTLNKKMNSKKLIEDIAKSTKCFPKFKNDGTFGFNTIKDSYSTSDYNDAHLIRQSDVISYSFKKTKPEQIYQKVDVQYNMDYAQNSLLSRTVARLGVDTSANVFEQIDLNEEVAIDDYDASFYGLDNPVKNSVQSYLEFESPYIRDKQTAENLRDFLFRNHKNDHLIFNLKLPLQYIDLEIGELVKFEELFQGLKAYGIDYTAESEIVQNSKFYPLFMITSISKNLDSISIECMQLHELVYDTERASFDVQVVTDAKNIKITEIVENDELYFDNKYDLKDLLEMQ